MAIPKKAQMMAKKSKPRQPKPALPPNRRKNTSNTSGKSKKSALSCCRKKKKLPVRPQFPPPPRPVVVKPKLAVAVEHVKPRPVKAASKNSERPTVKRAISVPSLRVEKSPLKVAPSTEDVRVNKKLDNAPKVTALMRDMENTELIYQTQALHIFSVLHKDRMITRWKSRETKPQHGCSPPAAKSRHAILLATRAKNLVDGIAPQKKKNSIDCAFEKRIRLTHVHREDDSSNTSSSVATPSRIRHRCAKNFAHSLPSINSFSESLDKLKNSSKRRVIPSEKTKKSKNIQGMNLNLSAETNVEFPSPRRHPFAVKPAAKKEPVSECDRKKLDIALTACENSVHRVGTTLKGLKTLAGQQLIPGVDNFQDEIDKMFVDMDRMLEWIALLSEKTETK